MLGATLMLTHCPESKIQVMVMLMPTFIPSLLAIAAVVTMLYGGKKRHWSTSPFANHVEHDVFPEEVLEPEVDHAPSQALLRRVRRDT